MKRLLSLVVLIALASTLGSAQSAKKADRKFRIWVANNGSASINVVCVRFENSLAASSENYFCWDACYNPTVDTSDGTLPIAAADTNKYFYGVYNENGGTGTSIITYCFYVNGVPDDSACFTFSFSENSPIDSVYGTIAIDPAVGIEFIGATNRNQILDIHPNPAKYTAALNYSLVRNIDFGELVVRNLLGSQVYRVQLRGTVGQVTIPVEEFNNGVYFCTMIVDNKVVETKRLVVNH